MKEDDKEEPCEICEKNKAVRWLGMIYVCDNCYWKNKYKKRKK